MICETIKPLKEELERMVKYSDSVEREMALNIIEEGREVSVIDEVIGDLCSVHNSSIRPTTIADFHTHPSVETVKRIVDRGEVEKARCIIDKKTEEHIRKGGKFNTLTPSDADVISSASRGVSNMCIGTMVEGKQVIKCYPIIKEVNEEENTLSIKADLNNSCELD